MPIIMCCPFYVRETRHHAYGPRQGIECEGAEIWFKSKEARRDFVYPWCADVKGFEECPIYKALTQKTDV